jgi:FAD:protein FMN transferase
LNNHFHNFQDYASNPEYLHLHQAMGTNITIKISVSELKGKKIAEKSIQLIDNLEQIMSFYRNSSQVNQINYKAGESWVSVSPELFYLIVESKRYARLTKGLFDITVGPLTAIWQSYGKFGEVPPKYQIERAVKLINYGGILLDEENKKVKLEREGQKIELGGIAKGYVANQIIELYREMGVKSGLINLGGSVSLLGSRYNGEPWGVGIQSPNRERGKCLGVVLLSDTSVVSSGDYERFFLENNKMYHHILNPYNGYSARSELRSVTIVNPDSMLADVLATTVFILGLKKGMELINHFNGIEVIMITDDKIYLSQNLVNKFHLIEKDFLVFQI